MLGVVGANAVAVPTLETDIGADPDEATRVLSERSRTGCIGDAGVRSCLTDDDPENRGRPLGPLGAFGVLGEAPTGADEQGGEQDAPRPRGPARRAVTAGGGAAAIGDGRISRTVEECGAGSRG